MKRSCILLLYEALEKTGQIKDGIGSFAHRVVEWALTDELTEVDSSYDLPGVYADDWRPGVKDTVVLAAAGVEYVRDIGRCLVDEAMDTIRRNVQFPS